MKRRSAATSCFRWPPRSRSSVSHSASASLGSSHDVRSPLHRACVFCRIAGGVRPSAPAALICDRTDPRNDAFPSGVAAASTGAGGVVPAPAAAHNPCLGEPPSPLSHQPPSHLPYPSPHVTPL